MASLHLRLHLLANSQTINHPPDSAYHSVHTHAHKHASLFIIPVLSATTHKHKIPAKIPPFQRSHSGVNITAHTHPLTHTQRPSSNVHAYTCTPTTTPTPNPKAHAYIYSICAHLHTHAVLNETAGAIRPKPERASFLQMDLRCGLYRIICQHCWEWDVTIIRAYCLIRQLSLSLPHRALALSPSLLLFSGGRDEWFQLCATKTKLGTWQFQYGLFICIKLIGCGFDGEVMWLHASQPHGWTCLFVCTQVNNLRLYFLCIARTRYLQIFWKIWIRCSFILFPLSWRGKKKNTAHCRAHSIMPVTQKLSSSSSSRPWSIRRQLWGRIETLVSLTTSQSIVADYWLVKLARVSVLLLWLCTGFSHIQTTVSTGYRLKNQ